MTPKFAVAKIAAAAAAFAILGTALPAVSTPAEAKPVKKIVRITTKHVFVHRRVFRPRLVVASVAAPLPGCYWLKVRAIRTGRNFWWNQYNTCIGE
jgi:hypothetical protein